MSRGATLELWVAIFCHPSSSSDVQVDRHLVCEPCGPTVAGGFDPEAKQVGTAPWGYSGVVI